MPLRGLMYFGNLYNSYIKNRGINIYSSALKKIPTPKYVVFYNGTSNRAPIEKLRLSDAFIQEDPNHEFEWTATMINLNAGKNDELLSKCKPLADYTTFVTQVRYFKTNHATLEEAINAAINYYIENDILADFLKKHRGDVVHTCLTEFDEEAYKNELLEEGRKEGIETASITHAKELFQNNAPYSLVRASIKELSDEELQDIYDEVVAEKLEKQQNDLKK